MMNERTLDLIREAREWAYKDHSGHTAQLLFEHRLAQVVVMECAAFVSGAAEVHNQAEQEACERAALGLRSYFGVDK